MAPVLDKDVFAIRIAGVGDTSDTSSTASEGYAFCSDPSLVGSSESNFTWRPDLLVNEEYPLQSLATLIEPFENRQRYSAFEFVMPASDAVAELLMYRQTEAPYELTSALEPSVTTVDLDTTGLDDTIIFVHGETILLGTGDGNGTYTGSTRKYFGSPEQWHGVGSNCYTKPPYWSGRTVVLYTYEVDGTFTERWRGRIDGSIIMNQGLIHVRCTELLGRIKNLKIGRSLDIARNQQWTWMALQGSEQRQPSGFEVTLDQQITKPQNPSSLEPAYNTGLQVGELLMWGVVDNNTYPGQQQSVRIATTNGGTPFLYSGENIDDDTELGESETGDVREVFFVDRNAFLRSGTHQSSTYHLQDVTENHAQRYPYHPLAIFGALTLSTDQPFADPDTFDILQGSYSADLKDLFAPGIVDTLHSEIQKNPDLQVDQALLSWDGQVEEVLEFGTRLLQAYGYYLGIDNNGKMTLQRIRLPDIEDYDNGFSNILDVVPSDLLVLDDGQDAVATVVQANLGDLPYRDGSALFVQGLDGAPRRAAELNNEPDQEVDFSFLARTAKNEAVSMLEARSLLQSKAYPRLRVRVNDWRPEGLDYSLGSVIFLKDLPLEKAWLLNASGKRVKELDTTDPQWAGFIVARRFLPMQGLSYEIDLLLTGEELVRWRAPSGIIEGINASNNWLILGTTSSFGDTISDPNRFEIGDEIIIRRPDGSLWDTQVREVAQDGIDYIELDGWYSTDPPDDEDLVVELADYGSYENIGLNGKFTNIDRAYAFLSDGQSTLGTADDDPDSIG